MKQQKLWLSCCLGFAVQLFASFAQTPFPPPGFYTEGACPALPGVVGSPFADFPKPMPVTAPAYYFPPLPATAEHPPLPIGFMVWRVECPGNPGVASIWLRMTPDLGLQSGIAKPMVKVFQGGIQAGWFGLDEKRLPSSASVSGFNWDWRLWPTDYMLSSPVTDNLYAMPNVPFRADLPFTFKVRLPAAWPADVPDVVYEIPARGQPGNVANVPQSLAGLWWNPAESGWGLILDRNERGTVFAGWLTYDDSGASTWFVMSNGAPAGDNAVEGDVYQPTGPAFSDPVFDSARFSPGNPVGRFRIEFASADSGSFSYSVNGRSGKQPISRLVVRKATGEACAELRGMWWNPNEAGWGLSLEGGEGIGCATHTSWFTYDAEGKPAWFFSGMPGRTDVSFAATRGVVYRPHGSPYGRPYEPARFGIGEPVGEFTVKTLPSFKSVRTFQYSIGGAARTVTVERFRFEY